jgi:hypothetical protein
MFEKCQRKAETPSTWLKKKKKKKKANVRVYILYVSEGE